MARLIAREIADEHSIRELDATALTVKDLEELENRMQFRGWGEKGGHAIIVNEAHGLRKDVIRYLLGVLERIRPYAVWVFTSTRELPETRGKRKSKRKEPALFEDYDDGRPLLSRCMTFALAQRDVGLPFAKRAKWIAEQEGLDGGQPTEAYVDLMYDCRLNFRAALQAIERGDMLVASLDGAADTRSCISGPVADPVALRAS
jgi:hypothetical protein